MNIDNLKEKISKIMENQSGKILTAKKIGKRNEYLFSIGETKFGLQEVIYENYQIIVFAESVSEEIKSNLIESINNKNWE